MKKHSRVMYIESKSKGLFEPARIGRVEFSKSGSSLYYQGKTFVSLRGDGCKANYCDIESGEEYWISGCRKDGMDALYNTNVEIDDNVREEYWTVIRSMPEKSYLSALRAKGKY